MFVVFVRCGFRGLVLWSSRCFGAEGWTRSLRSFERMGVVVMLRNGVVERGREGRMARIRMRGIDIMKAGVLC